MQTPSQCLWVRIGRPILTALFLLTATAARAAAQDSTVSATMLRVLAEVADQFRTGRPVFLVADHRFPHNVAGPFASYDEANRVRADSGTAFGVFGPYVTARDSIADSSRVLNVRVTVQTPKGRVVFDVDPAQVDALFFSNSAVDKFVLPYYTSVYGPEYAASLDRLAAIKKPIGHCLSRICWPAPPIMFLRVVDPVPLHR